MVTERDPSRVIHARLILDELRKQGVTDVLGVPDSAAKALLDLLAVKPTIRVLTVTREGEAFAIAAGLLPGPVGAGSCRIHRVRRGSNSIGN